METTMEERRKHSDDLIEQIRKSRKPYPPTENDIPVEIKKFVYQRKSELPKPKDTDDFSMSIKINKQ